MIRSPLLRPNASFALLLLCFFLSGLAALMYETAWTREFAFVFGTSELAVSAVLAAYMTGLAAGAALAAKLAPRLRRPVLAYGLLELGIALGALAVPWGIRGLTGLYIGWLGGLDAPPETIGLATALFHLVGAFVVMVPCTAMMGATLPLLARHAVRSDDQIGPRIGVLYGVNTAGAIAGALLAAFVLLPAVGLRQTIYVAALVNGLVFVAAALLARRVQAADYQVAPQPSEAVSSGRWILPIIAISGAISFVYEVMWTRLLGFVMGGSTAAFATMLASFLIGIAAGSAVASRLARRPGAAAVGFVVVQLGAAVAARGAFAVADALPDIATALQLTPDRMATGALTSVLVLLPFTLCIGATFPFAVRLHAQHAIDAAPASARVYAWNTLGSVAGAVGAGFWLLPTFGFEGTATLGVLGNLALAVAAALAFLAPRGRLIGVATAAVLAVATVLVAPPVAPERLMKSSPLAVQPHPGALEFVGVGRSATVALIDAGHSWRLTTNGLPDALISRPEVPFDRLRPARWLTLLPILARPDAEDLLLIGLGGGGSLAAITPGLRSVDVIELEPEVVEANAVVSERRRERDPLADPRVSLYLGDARGALMLSGRTYDAVVSQPSHPWTSGASHLYTRNFFELVRSRLRPDGVFVQWIGLAFVNADLVRSLLATLQDVFPYVEAYQPEKAALLFVASATPLDPLSTAQRAIESAPEPFGLVGVHSTLDVALARVLDSEGTRVVSAGAELVTDDHNRLASSVGRLGEFQRDRRRIDAMLAAHDPLPAVADSFDLSRLMREIGLRRDVARGERLIAGLDEAHRDLARGWAQLENGRDFEAQRSFREALAEAPDLHDARIGLALLGHASEMGALSPRDAVVAEAIRLGANGDLEGVRRLDAELASWRPGELLYPEAALLRVDWRLAAGGRREAEEALEIADELLTRRREPEIYLARAQAAALAGRPDHGWVALDRLSEIPPPRVERADYFRALEIAKGLPEGPYSGAILTRLEQRVGRSIDR